MARKLHGPRHQWPYPLCSVWFEWAGEYRPLEWDDNKGVLKGVMGPVSHNTCIYVYAHKEAPPTHQQGAINYLHSRKYHLARRMPTSA